MKIILKLLYFQIIAIQGKVFKICNEMGEIMSDKVRILQSDWFDYWHQIALLVEHLIVNRHSGDPNLGLVHHYFSHSVQNF